MKGHLVSVESHKEYPLSRINEQGDEKEPLEVRIEGIEKARICLGESIVERFQEFLPFKSVDMTLSLGEGQTPILQGNKWLKEKIGHSKIYLKNETQNPTWSFKDRGSFTCCQLSKAMKEKKIATISTGNMGQSMAAYGANAGLDVIIFVPSYAPKEKIEAMGIHGAMIYKIQAPTYSEMKQEILSLADKLNLRIISGNHPIRVEGYKITAFELYEQLGNNLPEYIAVPTSACGHIRGLHKGFTELKKAGYIQKLPKMIIVQAENNAPIVKALEKGKCDVVPYLKTTTVAEAITSGNPYGGKEILKKARKNNWLYASVSEKEILEGQRLLAKNGIFAEASSATSIFAIKKLVDQQKIEKDASVLAMITGSGLKDMGVLTRHRLTVKSLTLSQLESRLIEDI